MSDLSEAVREIKKWADDYEKYDKYYRGEVDEVFSSPRIQRLLKDTAAHYRINMAAKPVNAVLNGLQVLGAIVPGNEDGPNEALTQRLKTEVWDPNELDTYIPDWLREIGKEGDAYLVVWEGDEDGTVDIHVCKPHGARMFYDPENPRKKRFFAMMWEVGDSPKRTRLNLWYDDRVEKYVSDKKNPKADTDFRRYQEEGEAWPVTHTYGEIPVFHGRSDHPYGVPDHLKAIGPQNMLTKAVSVGMSGMDFTSFPQRAALMDKALDDDGDAWDPEDEEGTDEIDRTGDDADQSDLRSHPGSLWMLRNVKELVQLPASDPDSFLKPVDKAIHLMSATTDTPMRYFLGSQGQMPSGAAIREDDAPLTARKERRRDMAGAVLADTLTFAMTKVLGVKCPPIVIQWAPVQRATALDEWQTVKAKQEAGVPRDVSLQEAGYTSERVGQWAKDAPDPAEGLAARVELLERLGTAAEKLATAAELGALDISVVQEFMAGFLVPPSEDDQGE